jgi:hypothetical protein
MKDVRDREDDRGDRERDDRRDRDREAVVPTDDPIKREAPAPGFDDLL